MEWLKGVFCIAVIMKFSSFRVTIKFLKYQLTLKYHLLQADIANYPLGCHLYLYCWGLLTKWRPNGVKDATSAPPHWQTVQTNACNWGPPSYVFYKPCDHIYKHWEGKDKCWQRRNWRFCWSNADFEKVSTTSCMCFRMPLVQKEAKISTWPTGKH